VHLLLLLALLIVPAAVRAAGDVQALVTDGELEVTGDDDSNVLRIAAGGAPGTLVLTGLEGTTVNGGSAAVTLTEVADLRLFPGKGDDRVELLQLDLPGRLLAKLGAGNDALIVQDTRVRGRARIRGGGDRDDITIRGFSHFEERLVIGSGPGPDGVTLTNVELSRGLRVDTGGGRDTVVVQFCGLAHAEELLLRTGDGEDAVTLLGSDFQDDVELELDDDDDDLLVEDCDFEDNFEADGGDGFDEIDFDGTNTFEPLERRRVVDFEGLQ
jgi:hypothetical protein